MSIRLLSVALVLHGAVHLIGDAKALGYESAHGPRRRVRPASLLPWTAASFALVAGGVLVSCGNDHWSIPGAMGIVLSQIAICTEWPDARVGTIVNIALALPVTIALVDLRGASLSTIYDDAAQRRLGYTSTPSVVLDEELFRVPTPLRMYLMRVVAMSRLRTANVRAHFHGVARDSRSRTDMRCWS